MNGISAETIQLIQYLLPGFLCAWVFYAFTSFQKPSQFEQTIQALIFTLVIQVIVFLFSSGYLVNLEGIFGKITLHENWELFLSTVVGIFLGLLFAAFSNNDKFHWLIRKCRISTETSYPSEWFGLFAKEKSYIVLHLSGSRRLYGWPKDWPSSPEHGQFALVHCSWLEDDDGVTELPDNVIVMVKASDVEIIEFMGITEEDQKNG